MVTVRVEKVIIPTYEIKEYDKNPMFLDKRVYQGSCGKVYPHPVCEGVSDTKTDVEYEAVFVENDYILVMILPSLGGRIQRLYDKTNGYDAVYYNQVVKPALVGLSGPWISGGIEFNWPQHHRPSTFDPVDYKVINNSDGSVTVWTGETEKMFHTKGEAAFTVYPDKAYLEIKGRVYNPTEIPKTFLWWANPAVSVNDYTRSIFPPDVNAVYDHGKRDVSKFPIADGVYYKVDYSPGTDISRYKNIPVPTSYMAKHSDYDFIGNYDDQKEAGLLHVASHHVSPGKKQWTWGNGDFGRAWDRNLTDEDGPYIELMTGVFTDNQPDFTFLKPFEEKTFVQYFMPYKACGAIKNANEEFAMNMEPSENGIKVIVYSSCDHKQDRTSIILKDKNNEIVYTSSFCLGASEYTEFFVECKEDIKDISMTLMKNGSLCIQYKYTENEEPVLEPMKPMPLPKDVESLEDLYLDGMHLEQYRHATYKPEDYYLEGLKRDASDSRLNNAYGKLIYKKGRFEESINYFSKAIEKLTKRNPNPYDCEAYYNLGLAYKMLGKVEEAYTAFYKATWDANQQDKAFYELACLECLKGNFSMALDMIDRALERRVHNYRGIALKAAILRHLGKSDLCKHLIDSELQYDPLDFGAEMERYLLNGAEPSATFRMEAEDIIDISLVYINAGLYEDAKKILNYELTASSPMIYYYLYAITEDKIYLNKAEEMDSAYCFPNRVEDVSILETSIKAGGKMAAYYLGCLLYDKGETERSIALWESVENSISLPTVHRNLALAYYNTKKDKDKALYEMELAYSLNEADVRVLFELDQLYKELEKSVSLRLDNLEKHSELLEKRDPLYTEYISLLNKTGQYEKALKLISTHIFHPWEGGEGKITAEYRNALMELSHLENDEEKAVSLLKKALVYPENLGEGKLIGQLDNDIYYYLAMRTSDEKQKEEYFKLSERGDLNLSSAMYYNDQPPEMMYYVALAKASLGKKDEAVSIFNAMSEYGNMHKNDKITIDYFAVSLPDFLVFETDLCKKNKKHCENLINLATKGISIINS